MFSRYFDSARVPASLALLSAATLSLSLAACGDSSAEEGNDEVDESADTDAGSDSSDASTGEEGSSGSGSETAETTADDTTTADTTTTEGSTDAGTETADDTTTADTSTDTSTEEDTTEEDTGIKLDVADEGCQPPLGGNIQSFIWIANSNEGTVSKIDTQALVEVGRYQVLPGGGGSPSRTSVNQQGDMAVAARTGGVTKIIGNSMTCPDTNGTPGVQTSAGPNDVVAWDDEECRAWHAPMPYTNMRAVAWTASVWDDNNCLWETPQLWVGGNTSADGSVEVRLLDGDDGTTIQTVAIPELSLPLGHGAYGAVVDSEDNLWLAQIYENQMVRVDREDFSYELYDEPEHVYGIAIDSDDRVFLCNRHVMRFDAMSSVFDTSLIEDWQGFYGHTGGCMIDDQGRLWKGIDDALYAVDTDTLEIVDTIAMPEGLMWGIAIDFHGYVWSIPKGGDTAYRVDPDTHDIESVGGLVGAYTYSDMTGFSLEQVNPQ
ncbi:hypothetical protein [Plesiocystis pacifica]|uniref:hypothetical protein n=1 Tax=Plesiocystis pacifica TaxID=191768 RepID=UPI0002EB5CE7|nr:hypothetical protein [Plesiocystis pacifica]